jgi:hypothetical protein
VDGHRARSTKAQPARLRGKEVRSGCARRDVASPEVTASRALRLFAQLCGVRVVGCAVEGRRILPSWCTGDARPLLPLPGMSTAPPPRPRSLRCRLDHQSGLARKVAHVWVDALRESGREFDAGAGRSRVVRSGRLRLARRDARNQARAAVPGRPPIPGTGRSGARREQKLWPLTAMQPPLRLALSRPIAASRSLTNTARLTECAQRNREPRPGRTKSSPDMHGLSTGTP